MDTCIRMHIDSGMQICSNFGRLTLLSLYIQRHSLAISNPNSNPIYPLHLHPLSTRGLEQADPDVVLPSWVQQVDRLLVVL